MESLNALITIALITLVGLAMYTANRAARIGRPDGAQLMLRLLLLLNALAAANVLTLTADPAQTAVGLLWGAALLGGVVSVIGWIIVDRPALRVRLRAALPAAVQYDPHAIVHTTAIVLILLALSFTVSNFALSGGLSGVADAMSGGIALTDVAFSQALWVLAATLGVGIGVRRGVRAGLERLGLRFPTVRGLAAGAIVGSGMFVFALVFTVIWVLLVSPETFAEQTAASSQVSRAFNTIGLAFGLSILAAFGEEIFFRGALQPIFGNVITSLFFIALHTQYTLTPASVMLFFTSLAFGWLRQRYDTSAAIAGHFVYNFVQLALAVGASG